jgi:DNA-binding transcriptional regulator YdaS (Cro superfamily)
MTYDQLMQRYGSSREAARKLGVAQNVVSNWRKRGIPLAWQRVLAMMAQKPKRRKVA